MDIVRLLTTTNAGAWAQGFINEYEHEKATNPKHRLTVPGMTSWFASAMETAKDQSEQEVGDLRAMALLLAMSDPAEFTRGKDFMPFVLARQWKQRLDLRAAAEE